MSLSLLTLALIPLVATKEISGTVKEVSAAFQARREGEEPQKYDTASSSFNSYTSFNINPEDCWWTATKSETDDYFALKAQKQADSDGKCGQCMYDRIMDVPLGSRRWEYSRLGKHQWATYTGDDYYVDWAKDRIPDQDKSDDIGAWITAQDVDNRGPEYTRIEQTGWDIPTDANKDEFWAFQAYWYADKNDVVFQAVMDAKPEYRAMEFSRLRAFLFDVPSEQRKTHWGDKLWQILHDGEEGIVSQQTYDRVQAKDLDSRGHEAQIIFNEGKMFYVCSDQLNDYDNYYDADGNYYDPYYDSGEGSFGWVGEIFRTIQWSDAWIVLAIIALYVILMGAGFIFFAPMMLCLIFSSGDLNECSLGIWGNGYTENPSKFQTYTEDDVKKEDEDDSNLNDETIPDDSDYGK